MTRISKTLLTLTLLLSLFAFSGSESASPTQSSGTARTEWVATLHADAKRIWSFNGASEHFNGNFFSVGFSKSELVWAAILKNNLVMTRIRQLDKLVFSIDPTRLFIHASTIPPDTEDLIVKS